MSIGYRFKHIAFHADDFARLPQPRLADRISGDGSDNVIEGTEGKDVLRGLGGDDALYGYGGNDVLVGGVGFDRIFGGDGTDTVSYRGSHVPITLDLQASGVSITYVAGVAEDMIRGIENIIGSALGDVLSTIVPNGRIRAGGGDDVIYVNTGGDALGRQRFDGGAGMHDVIDFSQSDAGVYISLSFEKSFRNIEDIVGSDFNDSLSSISVDSFNTIHGGFGDDSLYTSSSNSITDKLYGDDGNDDLSFQGGYGEAHGGTGDDRILITNYYLDKTGSFIVDGGTGNDTIYFSDIKNQSIILALADEGGTASFSIARGPAGSVTSIENVHGNNGNDILTGNSSGNILTGDDGANILDGGAGSDILIADDEYFSLGDSDPGDLLTGGGGADTFVFWRLTLQTTAEEPIDRITDFSHADGDRLDLSRLDANTLVRRDDDFTFIGDSAFGSHAGELRYEIVDGATYVTGDVDGDGAADFTLKLDGAIALVADDFRL